MSTGIFFNELHSKHDEPNHAECAQRVDSIMEKITRQSYYQNLIQVQPTNQAMHWAGLAHEQNYLNQLENIRGADSGMLDMDTYYHTKSLDAAYMSVNGVVDLCLGVAAKDYDNAFAITRPPGHHAKKNAAMGFCFLSTVAIAAKMLISQNKAKKVAIIDFDVHHGNGTEDCVEGDPNILFISTHQENIFPQSGLAKKHDRIINLPILSGTSDSEFNYLFDSVIAPVITNFSPDFLLISAGYDAHISDPLAGVSLTSEGFGVLSSKITQLGIEMNCLGPVFVLEGGYDFEALAESVNNSFLGLVGKTNFDVSITPEKIRESFSQRVDQYIKLYL